MALIFFDGFDQYNTDTDLSFYYALSGGISKGAGRYGGTALYPSGNGGPRKLLNPATNDIWVGYAVQPIFRHICSVGNQLAQPMVTLSFDPGTLSWTIMQGNSDQSDLPRRIGRTPNDTTPASGWHWVDLRVKLGTKDSETPGIVELWVDNVKLFEDTNCTTYANYFTTPTSIGSFEFVSSGSYSAALDDLYILDTSGPTHNTRLGDSRIDTVMPTSDAGPNNGVPSEGTDHFAVVDDQYVSTGDYVTLDNIAGQSEVYTYGDFDPALTGVIHGVRLSTIVKKSDAGPATMRNKVISGGTTLNGATESISTNYIGYDTVMAKDPNTGANWTLTAANALKAGIEVQ